MKKSIIFFIIFLCAALSVSKTLAVTGSLAQKTIRIATIVDGPMDKNASLYELFKKEIIDLTEGEFKVLFPEELKIEADWTSLGVKNAFDKVYKNPKTDMVLAMGLIASTQLLQRKSVPKITVAPFTVDFKAQYTGIHLNEEILKKRKKIKNLSYITNIPNFKQNLILFKQVADFKKMAFVFTKAFYESIPEMRQFIDDNLSTLDASYDVILAETDGAKILSKINKDIDAVHLCHLLVMDEQRVKSILDGLVKLKIPSFSSSCAVYGKEEVKKGLFMVKAPEEPFKYLSRRVAIIFQSIMLGEKPEDIITVVSEPQKIYVNMKTARAIGVSPSNDILNKAQVFFEENLETDRVLSLTSVIEEALQMNLDLAVKREDVIAQKENIDKAIAKLLPQLKTSMSATKIDRDRARATFSTTAERTLTGSVEVDQIIYSDIIYGNVTIERRLHNSRKEELEQVRLDTILDASITYLDVLRNRTFLDIQKENLKHTITNLELSKVRLQVGESGPGETYRWESEKANDSKAVSDAKAALEMSKITLNRILNKDGSLPFRTKDVRINDPELVTSQEEIFKYVKNMLDYEKFKNFMVQEGMVTAPEIKQVQALIDAQKRKVTMDKREVWLPTFSAKAKIEDTLHKEGAGSGETSLPSILSGSVRSADDTNWYVGLNMTYTFLEGGSKLSDVRQSNKKLKKLVTQKRNVERHVEQNIRLALEKVRSSYDGIGLYQQAVDAARKNFELMQDSYSRGVANITDLLNAQRAFLTAGLSSTNAVHEFITDLLRLSRAVGTFDMFSVGEKREKWLRKLDLYFEGLFELQQKK